MNLLIKNLSVSINKINILNGINLNIPDGEIHAIMGPNGSGKSTLALALAGHPSCQLKSGKIIFNNKDITHLQPEYRSKYGIFLAFQHPIEIPGVNNSYFLRTIIKSHLKYKKVNSINIVLLIENYMLKLGMSSNFLKRDVNDNFSGGEKKRNEIIQMILLQPKISILDEIDSGLDIDALKFVAVTINNFLKENKKSSIILVTHYNRLFKYIIPKKIHVIKSGKIITTGNVDLVQKIETQGYQVFV